MTNNSSAHSQAEWRCTNVEPPCRCQLGPCTNTHGATPYSMRERSNVSSEWPRVFCSWDVVLCLCSGVMLNTSENHPHELGLLHGRAPRHTTTHCMMAAGCELLVLIRGMQLLPA